MKKLSNKEMKDKIYKISFNCILMALMTLSIGSCASDKKPDNSTKTTIEDSTEVITIREPLETFNEINFYFENSGSMNGYLEGKNFKQTMHEIIDDNNSNFNPYFVNTKEYATSNLLSKIDSKSIGTKGTNSSDHEFIFTNAIKNAIGNNLSIVVTDGIYSTPNGDVDIVEVDIKKAFIPALEENAIETVVLKLSSQYIGTYYTESDCVDVKNMNQERPYYILLFGNKNAIDNALKNIIIEDLPGFKEQARFFLIDNLKVNYTILTQGEEKKGSYRKVGRGGSGLVKKVEETERFNRGNERYLQFAIAIDYSKTSIPDSYLLDKKNYKIDGETKYEIEDVKTVESIPKSTRTYKALEKINIKEGLNLSHLIIVKAEIKYIGELEIKLDNNLPSWIKTTGLENDCEIKNNKEQTFAFDKLMTGISEAYNKVNNRDEFLKLTLNIKH